jgi:hypothetical protein
MAQHVHVPSSAIGGVGSSRQAPTRSTDTADDDEDDEDVDRRLGGARTVSAT